MSLNLIFEGALAALTFIVLVKTCWTVKKMRSQINLILLDLQVDDIRITNLAKQLNSSKN